MVSNSHRNLLGGFALAVSIVSMGLAIYLLSLVRATMDTQSKTGETIVGLQQKLAQSESKLLEANAERDRAIAEKNAGAARIPDPNSSSVLLARIPFKGVANNLEAELDLLAERLKTQFPNQADALHVVAMLKAQTRKYGEAQSMWQECLRIDPKRELHYINLASIAIEQGNNALALDTLRRAVAFGFDSIDLTHHFALALSNSGEFEEASQVIEASLKKFPSDATHWLMLGQAKLELGKPSEAEECFRKSKELGMETASLYVGLGNACLRQGKRDEAREYLKTYSEIKSRDNLSGPERYQVLSDKEIKRTATSIFTEAAAIFYKKKDVIEAERLLLRCVAIDPSSLASLRAVADLYFKTKMLPEERTVRERVLELGSEVFSDYVDLAKVCATQGDRSAAEAALKLAVNAFPQALEPYATMSQFYLESGNLASARWYAQQSIERQPTPQGFRFLAAICEKMNDRSGAEQANQFAQKLEADK